MVMSLAVTVGNIAVFLMKIDIFYNSKVLSYIAMVLFLYTFIGVHKLAVLYIIIIYLIIICLVW